MDLKPDNLGLVLSAVIAAGGVAYWAITTANTAAATASNLDRSRVELLTRLERIDNRLENLPAFVVRLSEVERRQQHQEGTNASIDLRINGIDNRVTHIEGSVAAIEKASQVKMR